jgi:pimeloyl-ACP methyl ester carboxylesterase
MPWHVPREMPRVTVGDTELGTELYYELHGDGAASRPVVWIMGLGTDLHGWEPQMAALAADPARRHLIFDNRGVGRSAKPHGPYTTAQLADDCAGLMDAVGISRADVVGISLGGAIAQELALRHPEKVASLALLATFARVDASLAQTAAAGADKMGFSVGDMMRAWSEAGPGAPPIDPKMAFRFLMPLVFSKGYLEREKEELKRRFERVLEYGFSGAGLAGQVAAAMKHDTIDRLAGIGVPTLVVTGTADRLVHMGHSRQIADRVPGARYVELEGGTHGLTLELAEPLNDLLRKWLAEV